MYNGNMLQDSVIIFVLIYILFQFVVSSSFDGARYHDLATQTLQCCHNVYPGVTKEFVVKMVRHSACEQR